MRRIGAGGMGEVFLAREEAVGRAVVVKKVLPELVENRQFVGRFRDEARVVVRLAHPNIARVYAMGEVEGQLYLAMEYVQGKTLSRLAYRLRQRGRMMPLGALLQLGQRLCEGLAYAHDATDETGHPLHLVHRDLSPANVCLSYAGEVKIIDFGAAQSTLKEQQTAPRVVIGNLTYMAPEQARKRFVDRRADVYAAGVLLWELFAWRPLPQRGDPVERWRRAAFPQWEPAGRYRPGLPKSVDAFLLRALAPEPAERFSDAAAMGKALAALKEKLTPGVGDADLARLMADAFPREKMVEERTLAELLREDPLRARTEQAFPVVHAPPTALAFEHTGIEAPEDYVPGEDVATEALVATQVLRATGAGEATETLVAAQVPHAAGVSAGAAPKVLRAEADADDDDEVTETAVSASLREAMRADAARHADVSAPAPTPPQPPAMRADVARQADVSASAQTPPQPSAMRVSVEGGVTRGAPGPVGTRVGEATEALESAKILGAIERASGVKPAVSGVPGEVEGRGVRAPVPGTRDAGPSPRRMTRETQVGFGVDISQGLDAAAVDARRRELVRAITGEDEAAEPDVDPPWLGGGRRRAWAVVALFAGACALGFGVVWLLAGS